LGEGIMSEDFGIERAIALFDEILELLMAGYESL
jgi:hypothetical protein